MTYSLSRHQTIEGAFHLLFWLFIFTAVNVNWQHNWFDVNVRPNTPAPLSVVCFPILFYLHAFWAIPNYLTQRKWVKYALILGVIFIIPELVRIAVYTSVFHHSPLKELGSRDSLLFGAPGIAWLSFISSLLYRLLADRLVYNNYSTEETIQSQVKDSPRSVLLPADINHFKESLTTAMRDEKLYLDQALSLKYLAEHLEIPEKKLSCLLNQYSGVRFTDFVNEYRIKHFIREAENGQLQNLSVSGLAQQCGFSSKATFYRAFKKIKGCTPSVYFETQEGLT